MTTPGKTANIAVYCDFENVALGVRDARFSKFDIRKVLEKLLLKGSIVVKKAYCDWARYNEFKGPMHEAAFELIEIPHLRMSGKNSADIRMVVDALDLCYTKAHVDTFVIVSGDSDFSPLVSKLRENNKTVIGVGVKNSTSDLLVASCDEFIFYDSLVEKAPAGGGRGGRGGGRGSRSKTPAKPGTAAKADAPAKADGAAAPNAPKKADTPAAKKADAEARKDDGAGLEKKQLEAIDLVLRTMTAMDDERGDHEKLWGSMVKQTLKRRDPGFSESAYGFRSFSKLLERAQELDMLELQLDEKSGGYVVVSFDEVE
jgi:uncharacterized protein (TIGR00288 family)